MTNVYNFIPGIWYKSHYNHYYFRFKSLRIEGDGGVYTSSEYSEKLGMVTKADGYISNNRYLANATPVSEEERKRHGLINLCSTANSSYSIF